MRGPIVCLTVIALTLGLLAGCSGGGGGSSPPEGEDAAETAATMSQLTLGGVVTVVDFDVPEVPSASSLNGGGVSFADSFLDRFGFKEVLFRHLHQGSGAALAEETIDCAEGGSIDMTCDVVDGQSILDIRGANCVEDLSEFDLRINGNFGAIIDDPNACVEDVDDSTRVELSFDDYTFVIEENGEAISRLRFDGSLTVDSHVDEIPDCSTGGGSVQGDFVIEATAVAEGFDVRVVAEDLSLTVEVTNTVPCQNTVTIDGTLFVDNDGDRLEQTYDNLQLVYDEGATTTSVTISGRASVPCMGAVDFETIAAIVFEGDPDDGCPIAGRLRITVVDTGETADLIYNADGSVSIDVDGDGSIELTRASCEDLTSPCL